ncbi:MAG: InlB B-repeat-containing protein [Candidatus Bathycorpusculaceae bacterium]
MTKWRRLAVIPILIMFLAVFSPVVVDLGFSSNDGGKIDLFTNKVPFDGRGLNQKSDAFQPQELVELYARVTYNNAPITNWLVAFQVLDPLNKTIAVCTNLTDGEGVASFRFRIPWPSGDAEQIVFGNWKAVATVNIADKVFMDTLTFQVGWILQVTGIKILNVEHSPQTDFLPGETIVFNLTVKNIALTDKAAVIIVDAFDFANHPIAHIIYENKPIVFQPGESFVKVVSQIPKTAIAGKATVSAVAYNALPEYGGVPYSPPCSSHFNVAVLYKRQYYLTVRTEPFGVVFIEGEKWYDEGTNVTLTAPEFVPVSPGVRYKFKFWDVDGGALAGNTITVFMDKNHTATAHYSRQYYLAVVSSYGVVGGVGWYDANETAYASLDAGVADHGNGTRRVFSFWGGDASGTSYAQSGPILMDGPKTAVANWKTQYLLVVATDPYGLGLQPYRSPSGEAGPAGGWWYDAYVNVSLSAPPISGYDFNYWDVDGAAMAAGVYHLIVYMNGPHNVTAHYSARVAGWFLPEWFYWILLLILALIIVLFGFLIYRRRRKAKKEAGEAFRRGWAAWYYGYNLPRKTRRI